MNSAMDFDEEWSQGVGDFSSDVNLPVLNRWVMLVTLRYRRSTYWPAPIGRDQVRDYVLQDHVFQLFL